MTLPDYSLELLLFAGLLKVLDKLASKVAVNVCSIDLFGFAQM
jgi:hypothetical protein